MYQYGPAIDKIINKAISDGEIVGANLLVIRDGEEKYAKSYGEADKANHVPMKRDTIFRLYSMSKPITATAIMILFERGELDLKDPVCMYLPMFRDRQVWQEDGTTVSANRDFMIWDCLNMTMGLPYPWPEHESGRKMDKAFKELIQRRLNGETVDTMEYMRYMAEIPLMFHPGEHWSYGVAADILAAVAEVVSGMKYGRFLEKEIFAPLGMKDTGFFVPKEKWDRFVDTYSPPNLNHIRNI